MFLNKINSSVKEIRPYVPGKPVDEVKRELGLDRVIKLASNENPYPPSPKVLERIRRAAEGINRYPLSDCHYLRQKLSAKHKVSGESIVFGNGSDELIVLCARLLLRDGAEAVLAKPSFMIYAIASALQGASLKEVPLTAGLDYDLEAMAAAVNDRTGIVFLGNPDNPSGRYFRQKEMKDFLCRVDGRALVFIDEAYYEYVNREDYSDSLSLLKDHKNVIVTRTFSKMYGLAGLRIGYGIGDPELIDLLNRLREPFNINSIAQEAALACLEDEAYYADVARKVEAQRRNLYDAFRRLGLSYHESHTNFILVKIPGGLDAAGQLLRRGIIVRDMRVWGLDGMIRISIGTEEENNALIKALEELL